MWVLPVLDGPSAMQSWRFSIHSQSLWAAAMTKCGGEWLLQPTNYSKQTGPFRPASAKTAVVANFTECRDRKR